MFPDIVRLIEPQPGTTWDHEKIRDRATRLEHPIPTDEPLRTAGALGLGLAYIPFSRLGIKGLIVSVTTGRRRPIQVGRFCFTRRAPGPSPIDVWVATCLAGLIPALFIVTAFAACAALFVAGFGNTRTTLRVAGLAAVTCWISMIAHEATHLSMLRIVEKDRTIGAVCHSWANVWIVAPSISPSRRRVVALAGPLAGAATCGLAALAGCPGWLCAAVAIMHVINLLPTAPDGRALFN